MVCFFCLPVSPQIRTTRLSWIASIITCSSVIIGNCERIVWISSLRSTWTFACGRAGISTLVSSVLLVLLWRWRRLVIDGGVCVVDWEGNKALRMSSSLIVSSSSSLELDSHSLNKNKNKILKKKININFWIVSVETWAGRFLERWLRLIVEELFIEAEESIGWLNKNNRIKIMIKEITVWLYYQYV